MKKPFYTSIITVLLATGCGSLNVPNHPSDLPLRYHNAQYDFTFFVPASWKGYSILVQQWNGGEAWHGPIIVLRHPQWRVDDPYQDIPIMVFTRSQWEACGHDGGFFPYAGGVIDEMCKNRKYVFGIYSRFAYDELKGFQEVGTIFQRNQAANNTPHLHPD
jgi:hypothetical protein